MSDAVSATVATACLVISHTATAALTTGRSSPPAVVDAPGANTFGSQPDTSADQQPVDDVAALEDIFECHVFPPHPKTDGGDSGCRLLQEGQGRQRAFSHPCVLGELPRSENPSLTEKQRSTFPNNPATIVATGI